MTKYDISRYYSDLPILRAVRKRGKGDFQQWKNLSPTIFVRFFSAASLRDER